MLAALALLLSHLAHVPAASGGCADSHEACAMWARQGECKTNPAYMHVSCASSCDTCETAARSVRHMKDCSDISEDLFGPGGISAQMSAMMNMTQYRPRYLSERPPVLLFESFINAEEAADVIRVGGHNFERSLAGFADGTVSSRTSSTSWCNVPQCENDEVMVRLKDRITGALGCPLLNTEHLQVLRYEPGQFYKSHHDQNSPVDSAPGPRVWTFFLYLSDMAEGGGTHFPFLNITVQPKTGAALVWPSVKDENVYADELLTQHEALPVTSGVKYAANVRSCSLSCPRHTMGSRRRAALGSVPSACSHPSTGDRSCTVRLECSSGCICATFKVHTQSGAARPQSRRQRRGGKRWNGRGRRRAGLPSRSR